MRQQIQASGFPDGHGLCSSRRPRHLPRRPSMRLRAVRSFGLLLTPAWAWGPCTLSGGTAG